ncbi:zinc protease [Symbiobacterium terraclitae]|uniref:Zinc protease n=1 Tax=Symbiobacterium terraclitae TaxID=557451 RepID=A0ABS4JT85_9FIRM|nr:pitrilysin family protein [Symbiobacterium terraclitae]MBP2018744.1 zinc protease [Symbiobacterium terraclitae]
MGYHIAPTRVAHLANGLRVLVRELRHAPVVTAMVWYGVGSRDEAPGRTGISHFLEHMMFKGTPRFPYGVLEEGVKRRGGMWNAFTSYDYTAYYEVLPAQHLAWALEVEADRMTGMTFDPDLTVRERGIIVSEREGSENHPSVWLQEAFMAAAYQVSPYGHPIIGSKADIRATTAEALTAHYRRYYHPNNATVVIVGDVAPEQAFALAERHFGAIPAGAPVLPPDAGEPEQTEERRVTVRRPGPHPMLLTGYKIPAADHPDQPALMLLSALLSGAPSFGGAGGTMGRSSRLYRKLVEPGLAVAASAYPRALQYTGLFTLSATPAPGVSPEDLEAALFAEVEALRDEQAGEQEFARAQKQVRAGYLYSMESALSQAVMLGSTALTQSVARFDRALEELEAVTPADVQRVARTYLEPRRRTVAWFIPQEAAPAVVGGAGTPGASGSGATGTGSAAPGAPGAAAADAGAPAAGAAGTSGSGAAGTTPDYQKPADWSVDRPAAGQAQPILSPDRVVRRTLSCGATLLLFPAASVPSVFVRVQMEAGAVWETAAQAGLAQMVAALLTRGSESFTAAELALSTDALGMSIRVDVGRETAVASLKCLPEDLDRGLSLLAEVVRRPTFPADEFERVRTQMLVAVRRAEDDTRAVAARRLMERIYPEGHPYRHAVSGTEASLRALAADDLAAFHRARYGPRGAVISVVGDIDPDRATAALEAVLDGWSGGSERPAIPAAPAPRGGRSHVTLAGKTQTDIALGWPLVDRSHPDYLALEVLATLFGGNGTPASSRLFRDVRERYGLSYYQYALFGGTSGPGAWTAHLGVNPARLDFAVEAVLSELRRLAAEPVPSGELEALQDFLAGYPAVQHEAPERIAARLAEIERFNLGLDWLERYPRAVAALTGEELRAVAERHLVPERLTIVTAGPERAEAEPAAGPESS